MKIDRHLGSQISLYALLGSTAGLLVWGVMNWAVYDMWHATGLTREMFSGLQMKTVLMLYMPLGLVLGTMIAMIEPIRDTSWGEALQNDWSWLLRGILLGGVAGFVGGWLGEFVLSAMSDPSAGVDPSGLRPVARLLGVVVFGLVLGTGLGLIDKWRTTSNDRLIAGLLGGGLGALLAGIVFQFLVDAPEVMTVLALMIFGALVAGSIGSISFLQSKAVLVGVSTNIMKYKEFRRPLLMDTSTFVGSGIPTRTSSRTNFRIAGDQDVMKEHCVIEYDQAARRWILTRFDPRATELLVNRGRVGDQAVAIRDGDLITIGRTTFRFQLER